MAAAAPSACSPAQAAAVRGDASHASEPGEMCNLFAQPYNTNTIQVAAFKGRGHPAAVTITVSQMRGVQSQQSRLLLLLCQQVQEVATQVSVFKQRLHQMGHLLRTAGRRSIHTGAAGE